MDQILVRTYEAARTTKSSHVANKTKLLPYQSIVFHLSNGLWGRWLWYPIGVWNGLRSTNPIRTEGKVFFPGKMAAPTVVGDAEVGLESVFPQELGLFCDAFQAETRYRLCGHELSIAHYHGARLGVAAPVWEAVSCSWSPLA